MELSKNALKIKPSSTLAITAKANELKAEGKDVVSFSIGEPDFNTPEHIVKAGIEAMQNGETRYTAASGTNELKKAICKKFLDDNNLVYEPSQIVVSNGAKHSLANIFLAIINEGDEVIIPAPYWLSYSAMVEIAGGKAVLLYTKRENNFMPTKEELESVCTNKTKAILINSPSNPTGMIAEEKQLKDIAKFVVEKDILVIADEIYEKLVYNPNKKHVSIASLGKDIYDRTIVVNGVSKSYSMTGWRIGYLACPVNIAKVISSLQSHMTSNPNSMAQKAALVALSGPQECVEEMRKEFSKRCDYIFEREENIPYISALKPEGAFYLFADVSKTYGKKYKGKEITDAAELATLLLENELVAVVPCADFGMPDYIRLSYACSMERIKTGMDRIETFMKELQ